MGGKELPAVEVYFQQGGNTVSSVASVASVGAIVSVGTVAAMPQAYRRAVGESDCIALGAFLYRGDYFAVVERLLQRSHRVFKRTYAVFERINVVGIRTTCQNAEEESYNGASRRKDAVFHIHFLFQATKLVK